MKAPKTRNAKNHPLNGPSIYNHSGELYFSAMSLRSAAEKTFKF